MKSNTEAYEEMKLAKSKLDPGTIYGTIGGGLIGWQLGTYLGGGKTNWIVAGIGICATAISIPYTRSYNRHAKKAVRIYNEGLRKTANLKPDIHFNIALQGI